MAKILGFLLGIAVALAGPAVFGVAAAPGGLELDQKEFLIAFGGFALVLWLIVSFFSGAAALGAALTFGAMTYAVHQIPNRTTDFLNDIPGVKDAMIAGVHGAVISGVVPVLAVITLIYAIQLMVLGSRRRRARLAEQARLAQDQQAAALVAERSEQYAAAAHGGGYAAPDQTREFAAPQYGEPVSAAPQYGTPDQSPDQSPDQPQGQHRADQYAQRMEGDTSDETSQLRPQDDTAQFRPDDQTAQYQHPTAQTAQYHDPNQPPPGEQRS